LSSYLRDIEIFCGVPKADVSHIMISHEESICEIQWFFGWAIKEFIDVSTMKWNKNQERLTKNESAMEVEKCLELAKNENTAS